MECYTLEDLARLLPARSMHLSAGSSLAESSSVYFCSPLDKFHSISLTYFEQ